MLYIHVHAYTCSRGVGEVLLLKVYISAPVAEPPVHLVLYWPGLTYLVSSGRSTAVCTIWVNMRRCSFPQIRYLHVHACQVAFPSLASRSPDGWSSPLVAILHIASLSPESNIPHPKPSKARTRLSLAMPMLAKETSGRTQSSGVWNHELS